ncbi:AlpA family phage regulatory protein [Metallibacterium sp.]|uniref:helix-turn-helix transcriptional regulator n=1 Tax=Metallibacterium sp. TaxID=2940281 RepID=UPI002601EC81|nr:AlpA family phage regulatory protein [Metallibacterium sp.]
MSDTPALLRMPQVLRATGLNRTRLYSLQRTGQFPRAVKISQRAVAWSSAEVEAWIAARIAERDGAGK